MLLMKILKKKTLMRTLGLSKEELRLKLEHISYDGVNAETRYRVRGGGSLNLVSNEAEFFKLPEAENMLTGSWDIGHRIQLVLGDVLLHNASEHSNKYLKDHKKMFELMGMFKDNKEGIILRR